MRIHYHSFSPNARRVLATAYELGFEPELNVVDPFKGEGKTPEFLRINPNGKVPALEDDDNLIWESCAIQQYLCEKKGDTGLYPKASRVDINRWQFWTMAHYNRHSESIVFENMVKGMLNMGATNEGALKEARGHFDRFNTVLNNHLEGRGYIVGDKLTIADFAIAPCLQYREPAGIDLSDFRRVQEWVERIERIDSYRRAAPPPM